jgi:hypothetical protein
MLERLLADTSAGLSENNAIATQAAPAMTEPSSCCANLRRPGRSAGRVRTVQRCGSWSPARNGSHSALPSSSAAAAPPASDVGGPGPHSVAGPGARRFGTTPPGRSGRLGFVARVTGRGCEAGLSSCSDRRLSTSRSDNRRRIRTTASDWGCLHRSRSAAHSAWSPRAPSPPPISSRDRPDDPVGARCGSSLGRLRWSAGVGADDLNVGDSRLRVIGACEGERALLRRVYPRPACAFPAAGDRTDGIRVKRA